MSLAAKRAETTPRTHESDFRSLILRADVEASEEDGNGEDQAG